MITFLLDIQQIEDISLVTIKSTCIIKYFSNEKYENIVASDRSYIKIYKSE